MIYIALFVDGRCGEFQSCLPQQVHSRGVFKTPPTKKPPGTPNHLKDSAAARPASGLKPPRTASKTGSRRDVASADGPDNVKARTSENGNYYIHVILAASSNVVECADLGAGQAFQ